MNEIITLSFGEYSNYVNTHFWNIAGEIGRNKEFSESFNNSILYNDNGSPRALVYDSSQNIRPYYSKNDKLDSKEEEYSHKEVINNK